MDAATILREQAVAPLKRRFVGRDEVVDLIALALVAGEHLFLYGPPGTAKSALIRATAGAVRARYFEAMLTRFTEPSELFGPVDLAQLRQGRVATVTAGMLPEAEIVFLDELFNANSAILNNLLTVLNERVYRRGAEQHRLPLLSLFTASNHLAEDEALAALFDRFLVRCRVEPLPRDGLPELLAAGWSLEGSEPIPPALDVAQVRDLAEATRRVDVAPILARHAEVVVQARDLGLALSDRRAVKLLKLVAASAVLSGRAVASEADLWPLRYAWDRPEQIGPLGSLIDQVMRQADTPDHARHPLSRPGERVDGEAVARALDEVDAALRDRPKSVLALARLRERLASIEADAAWIADEPTRQHLLTRAGELAGRLA